MTSLRRLSDKLYAVFSTRSLGLSLFLGTLFSSSFGLALLALRQIHGTQLPDELSRTIQKILIPSAVGFGVSMIVMFFLGKALSKQDGFTYGAKIYGCSFLVSGLHAIFFVAAGAPKQHLKTFPLLSLVAGLFMILFLITYLFAQYFTYFGLKKAYQIGRLRAIVLMVGLLAPAMATNFAWAMPQVSERAGAIDPKFLRSFKSALGDDFSMIKLSAMMDDHAALLTPTNVFTQMTLGKTTKYPLSEFKHDKLYKRNIDKLLGSSNQSHRDLAYLVIGSAGDLSKEAILLERITTETDPATLLWAATSLMNLNTVHTTAIFDFLLKNHTLGDAHLLPLALQLDPDSLRQTANARIHLEDPRSRFLAEHFLSASRSNK